jgi:hypothetical protein
VVQIHSQQAAAQTKQTHRRQLDATCAHRHWAVTLDKTGSIGLVASKSAQTACLADCLTSRQCWLAGWLAAHLRRMALMRVLPLLSSAALLVEGRSSAASPRACLPASLATTAISCWLRG